MNHINWLIDLKKEKSENISCKSETNFDPNKKRALSNIKIAQVIKMHQH